MGVGRGASRARFINQNIPNRKVFNTLVAAGKAAGLVETLQAKTVNGAELAITVGSGGVLVNDAKVVATDIAAGNAPI